jgi:hypothetical protein
MHTSHQPRSIRLLPLLALGIASALLAGCHRDSDDAAMPSPASTQMPADTMPAAPSTMETPMPATGAEAYGTQDTSNEAPAPASAGMPPPVDSSPDATRDDVSPANPASPPDGGKH